MEKKASPTIVGIEKRITEEVLAIPEDIVLKDVQIFYKLQILTDMLNGKKYSYDELEAKFFETRNLRKADLRTLKNGIISKLTKCIKKTNSNLLNMRIIYALDVLGYPLEDLSDTKEIIFLRNLYYVCDEKDILNLASLADKVIIEKELKLAENANELKLNGIIKRVCNAICTKNMNYEIFENFQKLTLLLKSNSYSKEAARELLPFVFDCNEIECRNFINKLSYSLIAKLKSSNRTVAESLKIIHMLDILGFLDRFNKHKGALQVTKFAYKLYMQQYYLDEMVTKESFLECFEVASNLDKLTKRRKK